MKMNRFLKVIFHLNVIGLLYSRWRFKKFSILPFRNTYLKIHKSSKSSGKGRLSLGVQWESGRYMPSQIVIRSNSKLQINGNFRIFTGHNIWLNDNATLVLGSGYICNNLNLSCFNHVEIGDNVSISENLTLRDSDNHSLDGSEQTKPIKIGNNVWIGINVTILKGVTIGDGAVIAAGALVNRDVPPKCLVAGAPAIVKKEINEWH